MATVHWTPMKWLMNPCCATACLEKTGWTGDSDAGFSALVDKTVAPAYVCLDGFQLRFGIDDGAGGAFSNNGILEPSEVRETLNLC